jgi:SAM-dependent methyltransferase
MDLGRRFAAIVVSFGSFMLLSGPGEAAEALDRMRQHLVPGGRLFLDVNTHHAGGPPPVGRESRREVQAPDSSTIVLVDTLVGYDAADRVERHAQCYEHRRAGRLLAREVLDFSLRRYERVEVERLLGGADFVDVTVCGDYVESTPARSARDWLCFVARAR